jgi:hypothetical protein
MMDGMAATHVRRGWTFWELVLASCCGFFGEGVAVLAFVVIFATVTALLAPYFHGLQWIVPVLTEGAFTGAYLGWLLLDLKDEPPRWLQVVLSGYLSVFVAASLVLNVWAGRASVPGAVAHGVVVVAFFGYLLLAKFIVHRLRTTPDQRRLEQELAAARRYRSTSPATAAGGCGGGRSPHCSAGTSCPGGCPTRSAGPSSWPSASGAPRGGGAPCWSG